MAVDVALPKRNAAREGFVQDWNKHADIDHHR